MKILVINGPNINMLGVREPDIYGKENFKTLCKTIKDFSKKNGVSVKLFQSNYEGDLVTAIQKALGKFDGIDLAPGQVLCCRYRAAGGAHCSHQGGDGLRGGKNFPGHRRHHRSPAGSGLGECPGRAGKIQAGHRGSDPEGNQSQKAPGRGQSPPEKRPDGQEEVSKTDSAALMGLTNAKCKM